MKPAIEAIATIVLIAATLTFAALSAQYVIVKDCGERGEFRAGDLVYQCRVKGWAQ